MCHFKCHQNKEMWKCHHCSPTPLYSSSQFNTSFLHYLSIFSAVFSKKMESRQIFLSIIGLNSRHARKMLPPATLRNHVLVHVCEKPPNMPVWLLRRWSVIQRGRVGVPIPASSSVSLWPGQVTESEPQLPHRIVVLTHEALQPARHVASTQWKVALPLQELFKFCQDQQWFKSLWY